MNKMGRGRCLLTLSVLLFWGAISPGVEAGSGKQPSARQEARQAQKAKAVDERAIEARRALLCVDIIIKEVKAEFLKAGIKGKVVFDDKAKYIDKDQGFVLRCWMENNLPKMFKLDEWFKDEVCKGKDSWGSEIWVPFYPKVYSGLLARAISAVKSRPFTVSIRQRAWWKSVTSKKRYLGNYAPDTNTLELDLTPNAHDIGYPRQGDLQDMIFAGLGLPSRMDLKVGLAQNKLSKQTEAIRKNLKNRFGMTVKIDLVSKQYYYDEDYLRGVLYDVESALTPTKGLWGGKTLDPRLDRTIKNIQRNGLVVEVCPGRRCHIRYNRKTRTLRYSYQSSSPYQYNFSRNERLSPDRIRAELMDELGSN